MTDAGVSQADLARACGVKPPSVHGWLSGKSKFLRGENLLTAARALRVSGDWLATGQGPKYPNTPLPAVYQPNAPTAVVEPATIGQTLESLNEKLAGLDAGTRETVANLTHEAICKPDKALANIAAIEALVRFATGRIETAAMAVNQKA